MKIGRSYNPKKIGRSYNPKKIGRSYNRKKITDEGAGRRGLASPGRAGRHPLRGPPSRPSRAKAQVPKTTKSTNGHCYNRALSRPPLDEGAGRRGLASPGRAGRHPLRGPPSRPSRAKAQVPKTTKSTNGHCYTTL
jgi:hypothetical protein